MRKSEKRHKKGGLEISLEKMTSNVKKDLLWIMLWVSNYGTKKYATYDTYSRLSLLEICSCRIEDVIHWQWFHWWWCQLYEASDIIIDGNAEISDGDGRDQNESSGFSYAVIAFIIVIMGSLTMNIHFFQYWK